jgi:hypothetical protein
MPPFSLHSKTFLTPEIDVHAWPEGGRPPLSPLRALRDYALVVRVPNAT